MMAALDRLLTIVATAALTSAVWLVAGGTIRQEARLGSSAAPPAAAAPGKAQTAGDAVPPRAAPPGSPNPAYGRGASLVIPVRGIAPSQLTDTFTAARGGGARVHDAIDIMAPEGTPVVAAAPGTIEKLFTSKPGGLTIYVRSADGRTIHYYAHLKNYAPGLAERQVVRTGQALGSVGYTGNANPAAPHLHFAVLQTTPQAKWWEPTTPINPYPLLRGK